MDGGLAGWRVGGLACWNLGGWWVGGVAPGAIYGGRRLWIQRVPPYMTPNSWPYSTVPVRTWNCVAEPIHHERRARWPSLANTPAATEKHSGPWRWPGRRGARIIPTTTAAATAAAAATTTTTTTTTTAILSCPGLDVLLVELLRNRLVVMRQMTAPAQLLHERDATLLKTLALRPLLRCCGPLLLLQLPRTLGIATMVDAACWRIELPLGVCRAAAQVDKGGLGASRARCLARALVGRRPLGPTNCWWERGGSVAGAWWKRRGGLGEVVRGWHRVG